MKGIILNTFSALRSSAQYGAEMITQLLFAELYEVLAVAEDRNWLKVKSVFDNYEGWLNKKFHFEIDATTFNNLKKNTTTFCKAGRVYHKNLRMPLVWGTPLPFVSPLKFEINQFFFQFSGEIHSSNSTIRTEQLLSEAWKIFQGTPYLWGGKTPFGTDCSGFVQQVFRMKGIHLPRDASPQSQFLKKEVSLKESKTGDLAFFEENRKITHVGIILKNDFLNRFIGLTTQKSDYWIMHAYQNVGIDVLDEKGILINGNYTHHLSTIKTIE